MVFVLTNLRFPKLLMTEWIDNLGTLYYSVDVTELCVPLGDKPEWLALKRTRP